jgi:hypothetical protein
MAAENTSPWRTLRQGGKRMNRSPRFLAREIKAGRLRAARVGGRGEYLLRDEWLDEWAEALAQPVMVTPLRRRA